MWCTFHSDLSGLVKTKFVICKIIHLVCHCIVYTTDLATAVREAFGVPPHIWGMGM